MAVLADATTGALHPLVTRTLVGRSHACVLRLQRAEVSGVHAELYWDGERWMLHDLGSRNGTMVDGHHVSPEEHRPVGEGCRMAFGTEDARFVLVDASPPGLVAIGDDGAVVGAKGGLLCLPSEGEPELTVGERRRGGWQLQTEQETRRLDDGERVVAGGQGWTIHLPHVVQCTADDGEEPLSVARVTLEFDVSRDEEHVQMRVRQGARVIELRPRAHDFFLLTLARVRLVDQQQPGLQEGEHGWIYRQELARRLKVERGLINLWAHRARRQFADAGVVDVTDLVERRMGAEQLRLGVGRLVVHCT